MEECGMPDAVSQTQCDGGKSCLQILPDGRKVAPRFYRRRRFLSWQLRGSSDLMVAAGFFLAFHSGPDSALVRPMRSTTGASFFGFSDRGDFSAFELGFDQLLQVFPWNVSLYFSGSQSAGQRFQSIDARL